MSKTEKLFEKSNNKFVMAVLGLMIILISFVFLSEVGMLNTLEKGCLTSNDCVPATCCHATSCIPRNQAPDCTDVFCTEVCEPGTMDCGQGHCECIEGSCKVVMD